MAQGDGSFLDLEQDAAGAPIGRALVGDGIQDLGYGGLDVVEGLHAGQAGAKEVGPADESGGVLSALLVAVVEVAESLAVEGGGTAGEAIGLGEVADADGHRVSPNKQLATSP